MQKKTLKENVRVKKAHNPGQKTVAVENPWVGKGGGRVDLA